MRNTNRNNIAEIIDRTAYTTIKNNLGGEHSLSFHMFAELFDEEINTAVCNEFDVTDIENISKDSVIEAILFILKVKPSADIIQLSKEYEKEFQEFVYHFVEDMPKDTLAYQQLISDYIAYLPDSTSVINNGDIGCLESEIEHTIEAHLYGVRHSKFYKYLYNLCSDELNKDLFDEFEIESIVDILVRELSEVLLFIGEWTPSYDTLSMISELEPHKITGKATK